MLFSIIIPVYQVEKYIACALSSVEEQSFADWEAVIVDDGSTDTSNSICREYCRRDERFKLIRQSNAGLSAARNSGLDAASGDYIIFLDGDDFLKPDALARLAEQIKLTPVDIICFNGYIDAIESPDGGLTEKWFRGKGVPWQKAIPAFRMFDALIGGCPTVSSTAMVWQRCYKNSFLKKYSLRFVSGRLHEDEEWTPRAFYLAESAAAIDYSGYCYRRRAGSIMAALSEKNLEHWAWDITDLCKFFSEHGFADAAMARPFLRAQLILFSSCVFTSLDCGRGRLFREMCAGRRIFRAISKMPFFHRVFIKEKFYALVAGMSLVFPSLYRGLKLLRHYAGRKSDS